MDIKSFVGKLHNILIQFSVKYVHNYAENIECYVLMLYILKCIYRIYYTRNYGISSVQYVTNTNYTYTNI